MDKQALLRYIDLKEEIKDLENRIVKLKVRRTKILEEGNVQDAVKGGLGGLETYHIEGFPEKEWQIIEYRIRTNIRILEARKEDAENQVVEVEYYLNSMSDSRMRRLITYRYIDGLSWQQIANRMGRRATADSVRMEIKRFLEEK